MLFFDKVVVIITNYIVIAIVSLQTYYTHYICSYINFLHNLELNNLELNNHSLTINNDKFR